MKSRPFAVLVAGALAAGGALAANGAGAADHLDAPSVQADGRTDINDLYVFQSPTRKNRTVLAMTVNPGAGVISGTTFDPDARYVFRIDDDGDARADHRVSVKFGKVREEGQQYVVRVDGKIRSIGLVGETSRMRGGGRATAGVFDDPFFFDLNGFNDGFNFTGDDFFAGLDVSAIVIELPLKRTTKESNVGVWATTNKKGKQIDRIGRPAINTVLIPSERKDEFNMSRPKRDPKRFGDDVRTAITGLSGDADYAAALADVLLPDLLTVNLDDRSGFLNGRQLADDVIDAELALLTKGALTTDGVDGNDADFGSAFPYLAPANN